MEFLKPTLKKNQFEKNGSQQKSDTQNYQAGKELNNDLISAYLQVPTRILKDVNFSSFLARGDFCRLLMTIANSLNPDQDQQNVGPDLGPNRLTLLRKKMEKVLK